jgi:DNA polymerase-3 subunit delta'
MNYDWLASARDQFVRLSAQLPHAMLIQSARGMGKHKLATEMVSSLLCEAPVKHEQSLQACGKCRNCTMFDSGNHPDFHYISSERYVESNDSVLAHYAERYLEAPEKRGKRKPRKIISVDQIRALIDNFGLSNHSADRKIALIMPADTMNINASNALLKLLEEPNPDSVIILVCNDLSRLPMTIRSRCIGLNVDPPLLEQAVAWLTSQGVSDDKAYKALAICGGAPLLALDYIRADEVNDFEAVLEALLAMQDGGIGPVETREVLLKLQPPAVLLNWLQLVINWLISNLQNQAHSGPAPWKAYTRVFSKLSRRSDVSKRAALFRLYDELLSIKKQDTDIVNPGLLLDKWLISYSRLL